ncbi:hypothetical protein C1H46_034163 [Malus baccata]|uniref:No apical meristem-associated C-terminal domain-containing protein n=1 Tax=Malus baccata TaxID=106549 RepID=A0A540L1E7_MALBA|nr:hypothetical protein C1H46_034163 [Malus baccata]
MAMSSLTFYNLSHSPISLSDEPTFTPILFFSARKVSDATPSPIQTPSDINPTKENHASLSQTRTSPKKAAKAATSKKQAKQKKTQPSSFEKELEEMQEKLQAMKLEKEKTLELLKEKDEILKTKEEDLAMKG